MPMTVGERIRELRLRLGMSPAALAHAADVTDSAISQIESGLTKSPSFITGVRIARALGVSAEELAGVPATPPAGLPRVPEDAGEELRRELAAVNLRVSALADQILALKAERQQPAPRRRSS